MTVMAVYRFVDTDETGINDFDISGESYNFLLETCMKYCSSFSVRVCVDIIGSNTFLDDLEPYRIHANIYVRSAYSHYGFLPSETYCNADRYEIRHYRCCREVCAILLASTKSVFEWICGWGYTNPEDPVFFRSDGSVFFSSIIHDGICMLFPRVEEDVSQILSKGNWTTIG